MGTRDDEYYIDELTELLKEEQKNLWGDLLNELYQAANGYWSMGAENKIRRIWNIASYVGFTDWEKIQYPLLTSGVYQQVLKERRYPTPDMDLDKSKYIRENNLWVYKEKWARTLEEIAIMEWVES